MKRFAFCVLMVSIVLVTSSAWADALYRCSDGTFTNKIERQCPPYEPKGVVHVQGGTAAQADEGKPPFAEVKAYQRPANNTASGR
jgi:hypothetical protein